MLDLQLQFSSFWHYTPYALTVFSASLLLLRERYVGSTLVLVGGLVWLFLLFPLVLYGYRGGVDSLLEAMDFEWQEGLFFLRTATEMIPWSGEHLYHTLLASVAGTVLAISVNRLCRASGVRILQRAALGVTATLILASAWQIGEFALRNANAFGSLTANFESGPRSSIHQPGAKRRTPDTPGLRLLVYIGEATSPLNLSVYGYPRNTTPNLVGLTAADSLHPTMLIWDNVFSTHTHTTPSLLEALSIGFADARPGPIWAQHRTSFPRTLSDLGLRVELVSNQSLVGSWSRSSLILFDGLASHFSRNKFRGNLDSYAAYRERPYDDEFFAAALDRLLTARIGDRSEVYFLHSYAGHGPYRSFIPERFHTYVDTFFRNRNPTSVLGHASTTTPGLANARTLIELVEAYDSAMRYIDHTINEVVRRVAADANPTVFVYFSDHGESPFTVRGHDSSRFVHEMARVPFMVFFNRAAVDSFGDRYHRMARLARQSAPATLAQLPSTLMELLAIDADALGMADSADSVPIGSPRGDRSMPILVRNTPRGPSYVDLLDTSPWEQDQLDQRSGALHDWHSISSPTRVYAASRVATGTGSFVCYHRSNTVATMLRGLMVTNCLELDVMVYSADRIEVVHPPKTPVGLELHDALDMVGRRAQLLWIDAKNIDDPAQCRALLRELSKHASLGAKMLVEFPPQSHAALDELATCAREFRELGFRVSWYVPTGRAVRCAEDLAVGAPPGNSCTSLRADLVKVSSSRLFSDLSFDYRAFDAVDAFEESSGFRLNAWGVAPDQITQELLGKLDAVIVDTQDPNHY